MFRYRDEDENPFQGWYSTVQPSSFEKRWKLVCVCLSVVASGSRWAFKLPELCAKDLHYWVRDRKLKVAEYLCLLKNLCVGTSE